MNRKALIPVAVVILAGAGLLVTCRKTAPSSRIKVSGNIEVTQTEVSFRIAGKVLERLVDEGQRVQEGQLLARLDAQDLAQALAMREADAAVARAALAELRAGSRSEEIEASRAVLEQARADLRRLEPDEARIRDLHQKGIVSDREFDATKAAAEASRAKVRQAEQQFTLVKKGPRVEDIQQGEARKEQAEQALALARTQLGYATLVSPVNGVVLSKNVEPREYVSPGTAVITVGDLSNVWMRAYVEETDLGRVKLGQRALLTTDSFPGRTFEGRITFISPEAEFTPKSIQTQKERVKLVYRIKIELPNPNQELKPGMPADAEILTDGK